RHTRFSRDWSSDVCSSDLKGRLLPGGAAYLLVPGFAGGSHAHQVDFAETLQALIRSLDEAGACGWIVDLRRNSGGNLWPMLLGQIGRASCRETGWAWVGDT